MNQIDYRAAKGKQQHSDYNQKLRVDDMYNNAIEVRMNNIDQKQKSSTNEEVEVDTNKPPSSVYDEEFHADAQE